MYISLKAVIALLILVSATTGAIFWLYLGRPAEVLEPPPQNQQEMQALRQQLEYLQQQLKDKVAAEDARLEAEKAEDTLRQFYQHVQNQECQQAMTLAFGYSIEQCRHADQAKVGEIVKVGELDNKALFKFSLSSFMNPSATDPIIRTQDHSILLKREQNKWKLDYSSLQAIPSSSVIYSDAKSAFLRPLGKHTRPPARLGEDMP